MRGIEALRWCMFNSYARHHTACMDTSSTPIHTYICVHRCDVHMGAICSVVLSVCLVRSCMANSVAFLPVANCAVWGYEGCPRHAHASRCCLSLVSLGSLAAASTSARGVACLVQRDAPCWLRIPVCSTHIHTHGMVQHCIDVWVSGDGTVKSVFRFILGFRRAPHAIATSIAFVDTVVGIATMQIGSARSLASIHCETIMQARCRTGAQQEAVTRVWSWRRSCEEVSVLNSKTTHTVRHESQKYPGFGIW
jgi:hypothetical protein